MRGLAGHPDRVLVGARVVPADVAACLHGVGDEALVDDALFDDDFGAIDRGVRAGLVADRPLEHDVVRGVLVELRRTGLHGLLGIDDGGERLPVDRDGFDGVVGLGLGLGDDRGDAFARPLDVVRGEDAGRVDVVLDARAATGRPGHGQRVVRDVGPDEDAEHPWHRLRGARVDRADVGVRVRAAQDGHVRHRLELDVVEVAAFAGDEARVLGPLDRLAYDVGGGGVEYVGHRSSPLTRWPGRRRSGSRPRPRGPPRRCSGSRYSGRCCLRSRRGSRRRSDRCCGPGGRRRS